MCIRDRYRISANVFLIYNAEIPLPVPGKISEKPLPDLTVHSPAQENPLLSAMDILFYIRPAYFSASFFLPDNNGSYPQASGYRENDCSQLSSLSGLSVLYLDRSLFLLPGLSFSPWLSIYWWIVSTGTIFQRFLLLSLWPLIVQHLSAIFHNHDQIKTLNENYYLSSFCTLISTDPKSRAYCSFFSIIIYLLYQNKCFVVFYEFEQICSNVQFIPSPIDVREFLLRLLNSNFHKV